MANLLNIENLLVLARTYDVGDSLLVNQTSPIGSSMFQVTGASTFTGNVNITGGALRGLNITTSGTQDTIRINRAATDDNAITKYQTADTDKWIVGLRNTSDDNFRFYNYGTSTDSLVIDTSGTVVGTGTYSGGGSVKIFEAQRLGGAVKSDWDYHDASPIRMSIGTSTSHSFAIKTADTPRLTINNSGNATFTGNVSLGDDKELIFGAAPDYKIYHNSTTNVNHISSLLDRQLSINANNIFLTNQANDSTFLLLNSTGSTFTGDVTIKNSAVAKLKAAPLGSTYGSGFNVMTVTGTSSDPFTSTIGFSNYNASDAMVIKGKNVGIGTTSPNQLLTLGGSDGTQTLSFTTTAYLGDQAIIGNIEFSTYNADGGYGQLANIYALKTGTNTNSGDITFWTKQNGSRAERIRIENDGTLRVKTGSIIIDSTGEGIYLGGTGTSSVLKKFVGFQGGGGAQWTPSITSSGGGGFPAYTSSGFYQQVGNVVTVSFEFTISNLGSASGTVIITNLPIGISETNTVAGYGHIKALGQSLTIYHHTATNQIGMNKYDGSFAGTTNKTIGTVTYWAAT